MNKSVRKRQELQGWGLNTRFREWIMGLPRADHMLVKGKELRDPWSFNIWFSPETILIYWPLNMLCFKLNNGRRVGEEKRERTIYLTLCNELLHPDFQEVLIGEDFWGKKHLLYLVCLQKQLRLTIPFGLLKHNYEIFFLCQIIWIWETKKKEQRSSEVW